MIVNKIYIGEVAKLNGMKMYRSAKMDECFTPKCFVAEDNLTLLPTSSITVGYNEWVENADNEIIEEFTKYKRYILKDGINWTPVTEFLNQYWRQTPNPPFNRGFGDQIENVLSKLPIDVQNDYIVQLSDLL